MTAGRKGFTLVDLLVVIACLAILAALPACALRRDVEQARRQAEAASCRANLKGIGMAIAMYRGEDRNARFPLLFETGNPEADVKPDHAAWTIAGLKAKIDKNESAMQNVWLLIDKGLVTEEAFSCPSDRGYKPREFADRADTSDHRVGWRSSRQFSYGMHFPYRNSMVGGEKTDNPAWLGGNDLEGSFVVMADKNPSQNTEPAAGVSPDNPPSNHGDLGFGYLMYSGAVNWKKGMDDSKVNGDDVYTINPQQNANIATPRGLDDQYIVRHPNGR